MAGSARLPLSPEEVGYAAGSLKEDDMIWVTAQQFTSNNPDSTYQYRLSLGTVSLLPPNPDTTCQAYHALSGQAKPIDPHEISGSYLWYSPHEHQYHTYSPWKLQVSATPNMTAFKIFVPTDQRLQLPAMYHQRCLLLRDGTAADVQYLNLRQALQLQQDRLLASPSKPTELRLQNADRSLGPLSMQDARLVPSLDSGRPRLLLSSSPLASQPGLRNLSLMDGDFRPLSRGHQSELPGPTPAGLLSAASMILTTAGTFVLKELTETMAKKALLDLKRAGTYRFIEPRLITKALQSPSRQDFLDSYTSVVAPTFAWEEEENILLYKILQQTKDLPADSKLTQTDLASGLALVSNQARIIEAFDHDGLRLLEEAALNFLSQSRLQIDASNGGLAQVSQAGSVVIVTYYLSVRSASPAEDHHLLFPLPAYHGQQQDVAVELDVPPSYRLSLHASITNTTAEQDRCAQAIVSQNYDHSFSSSHPACLTRLSRTPLARVLASVPSYRFLLVNAKPGAATKIFLSCSGTQNHRWRLDKDISLFLVPASCEVHVNRANKLVTLRRQQSEPTLLGFRYLLAYDLAPYGRALSEEEKLNIIVGSLSGTLCLLLLISVWAAFHFKSKLLSLIGSPSNELPPFNSYADFRSIDSSLEPDVVATDTGSTRPPEDPQERLHVEDADEPRDGIPLASRYATIRRNPKSAQALVMSSNM